MPLPVEDYAYDGEGNRLASHLSAFYAPNAPNQPTEDSTYTYAFDSPGNRVSRTAQATGAFAGAATCDSLGRRSITGKAIRSGFTGREHNAGNGLIQFRVRAQDLGMECS